MKKYKQENQAVIHKHRTHRKRGPSSFNMHDSSLVFEKLNIKKADVFVDLGCGSGDYSLLAAQLVSPLGKVYAMDIWSEMLTEIENEASRLELDNVITIENDICQAIPLDDNCADHCLLATVMHAQKLTAKCKRLFPEISRILKPGAQLAVIECKKEEMPFGPPLSMRISPEELEVRLSQYGLKKTAYVDLGCNYMLLFELIAGFD